MNLYHSSRTLVIDLHWNWPHIACAVHFPWPWESISMSHHCSKTKRALDRGPRCGDAAGGGSVGSVSSAKKRMAAPTTLLAQPLAHSHSLTAAAAVVQAAQANPNDPAAYAYDFRQPQIVDQVKKTTQSFFSTSRTEVDNFLPTRYCVFFPIFYLKQMQWIFCLSSIWTLSSLKEKLSSFMQLDEISSSWGYSSSCFFTFRHARPPFHCSMLIPPSMVAILHSFADSLSFSHLISFEALKICCSCSIIFVCLGI